MEKGKRHRVTGRCESSRVARKRVNALAVLRAVTSPNSPTTGHRESKMTTTYKLFGGDLGSERMFVRCDLSQASAPVMVNYDEGAGWEATQWQCADCAHTDAGLAQFGLDLAAEAVGFSSDRDFACDVEDWTGLAEDADTSHETAQDWYESYGQHLSTVNAGDVCIQAVDYDWLDDADDSDVRDKLIESDDRLSSDEAEDLVSMARSVREAADEICGLLGEAVEAYEAGDYEACIQALEAAKSLELDHGDCPASSELRSRLIATLIE